MERARLGPDTFPAADIAEVMTANAQVMESAAQPPHEERPDLAEAPPIPGSETDAALAAAWNQLLLGATPAVACHCLPKRGSVEDAVPPRTDVVGRQSGSRVGIVTLRRALSLRMRAQPAP